MRENEKRRVLVEMNIKRKNVQIEEDPFSRISVTNAFHCQQITKAEVEHPLL